MTSSTENSNSWVSPHAIVEAGAELGSGTRVWEFTKIRSGAKVGKNVTIGMGVYIGPGVIIGDNCKIQNGAQIFEPAVLGVGVFVGPGTILTNDRHPSAVNSSGSKKSESDWTKSSVVIEDYASVGAGVICVAPVLLGKGASVGAGAVVTKDVKAGELVLGVPASPVNGKSSLPYVN